MIASNDALKTQVKSLEAKVEMLLKNATNGASAMASEIVPSETQLDLPLTDLGEDALTELDEDTQAEVAGEDAKPPKAQTRRNRKK